ncbi:hypothetical protein K493DRAFT_308407 [Basidiobolus meristosporus CBS 931.73]|uniref:G protein gamma domain-containing protein n=1 Tax=Basidiobolus meristosporus CBS 931.73 TaxID=1314790 RepID=A0A1Y1X3I4_9FUNG|nr:hypothetical protein K493DRAFT_308407 [Basidiobolus meristosporus CBS 931.73]|eukprot:ORX80188.1 hypothetical protein K493DRAFT_308407 [Basidiobolus meristosporus CBS 931.73]
MPPSTNPSQPTKLQIRSSGMAARATKFGKNRVGAITSDITEDPSQEIKEYDSLAEELSRERIPVSQASCSLINYAVTKRDLLIPSTAMDRAIKRSSRYNIEPTQSPPPCLCQIM